MTENESITPPDLSGGNIPEIISSPKELGIDVTETLGFSTSPTIMNDLIKMISLPKGKVSEFPKIVLNFDSEQSRILWANKQTGMFFLGTGFASYNYFDNCWGNGSIGLTASKLLEVLEDLRVYKEITFWANPKSKIWGLQAGDIDQSRNYLENINEIKTHLPVKPKFPSTFDEEYKVVFKEPENNLIYGIDVESTELKLIYSRGEKYKAFYPFNINKDGISVSFGDLFNPKEDLGANKKKLIPKPSSLRVPSDDKNIEHILGPLLEGPATNLRGIVSMFFSGSSGTPVQILKKDKNTAGGILISSYLIQTMEKDK